MSDFEHNIFDDMLVIVISVFIAVVLLTPLFLTFKDKPNPVHVVQSSKSGVAELTISTSTTDDTFLSYCISSQSLGCDADISLESADTLELNYSHDNTWLNKNTDQMEMDHSHMVVTVSNADSGEVLATFDTSIDTEGPWIVPVSGVTKVHLHQQKVTS